MPHFSCPLTRFPPLLDQRFPNPRGTSWRLWSSEWSGTTWLQPRPRPRVTNGRHACMNELSRCVGGQINTPRSSLRPPNTSVPCSNTKTPFEPTRQAELWMWRSCQCPQVGPTPSMFPRVRSVLWQASHPPPPVSGPFAGLFPLAVLHEALAVHSGTL